MPRKLLTQQIITYPKKIVYKMPENEPKNFFEEFLRIFFVEILAAALSVVTAGGSEYLINSLEISQIAQRIISSISRWAIDFTINTVFDQLTNQTSASNILFNAIFAVSDIGSIGRGLREQKLIKILNQSEVLSELGIGFEVKNLFQLKNYLSLRDVILKDNTKISFNKIISDAELLSSIFLVANSGMKKEIKKLSYEQLKSLIDIERAIYRINPNLILKSSKINERSLNKFLIKELGISYEDFLYLDDLEAVEALLKLKTTKIGRVTLNELNLTRMQSQFQLNIFETFKKNWKNLKNKAQKINPFKYLKDLNKEITRPIEEFGDYLREKTSKYLPKIPKIGQKIIKENNLIPCQPQSFLLAFKFEPVTVDGTGFITIYKKPYLWKKEARISNYKPVRVWTNLIEVERFVTASSQNNFYNQNWALGYGFSQAALKQIRLIDPNLQRIISQITRYYSEVNKLVKIIDSGLLSVIKATNKLASNKSRNFFNQLVNSNLSKVVGAIPLAGIFTSSIIKSIRSGEWQYSWIRNDVTSQITRKSIRKIRGIQRGKRL